MTRERKDHTLRVRMRSSDIARLDALGHRSRTARAALSLGLRALERRRQRARDAEVIRADLDTSRT